MLHPTDDCCKVSVKEKAVRLFRFVEAMQRRLNLEKGQKKAVLCPLLTARADLGQRISPLRSREASPSSVEIQKGLYALIKHAPSSLHKSKGLQTGACIKVAGRKAGRKTSSYTLQKKQVPSKYLYQSQEREFCLHGQSNRENEAPSRWIEPTAKPSNFPKLKCYETSASNLVARYSGCTAK